LVAAIKARKTIAAQMAGLFPGEVWFLAVDVEFMVKGRNLQEVS